jgi:NADPH-dependent ferric siderophore reductase
MRHYTVTSLREQMRDFDVDVKLWGDGIHEPQIIARGYK